MTSKHVKCGMTKTEWERVKALLPSTERMFHKSHDGSYYSKGNTYNAGRNKVKREKKSAI